MLQLNGVDTKAATAADLDMAGLADVEGQLDNLLNINSVKHLVRHTKAP